MADFYVKYGSNDAKLIAQYRVGNCNIKLHQVSQNRFVISKNRKILQEVYDMIIAVGKFNAAVAFEAADLFNP